MQSVLRGRVTNPTDQNQNHCEDKADPYPFAMCDACNRPAKTAQQIANEETAREPVSDDAPSTALQKRLL